MKGKLFLFLAVGIASLTLSACATRNCIDCGCTRYTCTTNYYTSPTICNSACPNPCDMSCANNNFNYAGCGDNCIVQ